MNDELERDDLDAWDVEPLMPNFEDRVLDALDATDTRPPVLARPDRRAVVWAAALSLAAAVAVVVALWPGTDASSDDAITIRAGASAQVDYTPGSHQAEQQRGTVTYRVRSGTPFVVHTPAADVTVRGTEFTVEMLTMQDERRRKYLGVGALAMGGAAVAVYVISGDVAVDNEHGRVAVGPGQTAVASEHVAPRTEAEPVVAAASKTTKPKPGRTLTPVQREGVQQKIAEAIAKRQKNTGIARPGADEVSEDGQDEQDEALGSLDTKYIQSVVSEDLTPLVTECYDTAVEKAGGLLGGSVIIKFSIAGDESVGGIVDDVELDDSKVRFDLSDGKGLRDAGSFPLADNPDFAECISESTASLLFDPPEGGGRVQVSYPFIFATGDDAPAAD